MEAGAVASWLLPHRGRGGDWIWIEPSGVAIRAVRARSVSDGATGLVREEMRGPVRGTAAEEEEEEVGEEVGGEV